MWLALAFISATFLGFYDTSKKASLKDNAVLPVLFLNTVFSTLIFSPFLLDYIGGFGWFTDTFLDTASGAESSLQAHLLVVLKAFIVLSSWICGYFGLKHLPLTIVGPINATRPVIVLVGAMLIFGERLNAYQWIGVLISLSSIFLMSRAGKKENIDFRSNRWIWCVAAATLMGAVSGLYDKHIMKSLSPMFVQSWFNLYQMIIMAVVCALMWYPRRHQTTPFHWSRAIPLISIFICLADFAYFTSLNDPDSMISVVSLVRRSSVIISFICGVIIFKERNIKAKVLDLALLLAGMAFIWLGTR
ncbi:MAG: DMT family transporter [Bacteroidales bacterium]|nr:DMT family transporter [Bacteroidales bacterium]